MKVVVTDDVGRPENHLLFAQPSSGQIIAGYCGEERDGNKNSRTETVKIV